MARLTHDAQPPPSLRSKESKAPAVPMAGPGRWSASLQHIRLHSVEARGGGIQAVLFSSAPVAGFRAKLQEQILNVQEMASGPDTSPVPKALHYITRSLLDWQAEVEAKDPGSSLLALVLLDSVESPAIAYIGDEEPAVTADARPFAPLWRVMRGKGRRVARASRISAGGMHNLSFSWSIGLDSRSLLKSRGWSRGKVEANWRREAPKAPVDLGDLPPVPGDPAPAIPKRRLGDSYKALDSALGSLGTEKRTRSAKDARPDQTSKPAAPLLEGLIKDSAQPKALSSKLAVPKPVAKRVPKPVPKTVEPAARDEVGSDSVGKQASENVEAPTNRESAAKVLHVTGSVIPIAERLSAEVLAPGKRALDRRRELASRLSATVLEFGRDVQGFSRRLAGRLNTEAPQLRHRIRSLSHSVAGRLKAEAALPTDRARKLWQSLAQRLTAEVPLPSERFKGLWQALARRLTAETSLQANRIRDLLQELKGRLTAEVPLPTNRVREIWQSLLKRLNAEVPLPSDRVRKLWHGLVQRMNIAVPLPSDRTRQLWQSLVQRMNTEVPLPSDRVRQLWRSLAQRLSAEVPLLNKRTQDLRKEVAPRLTAAALVLTKRAQDLGQRFAHLLNAGVQVLSQRVRTLELRPELRLAIVTLLVRPLQAVARSIRSELLLPLQVAVAAVLIFGLGWTIGSVNPSDPSTRVSTLSPGSRFLNVIGFGGASYLCSVTSIPAGAVVRVDGKILDAVTPVEIELVPGDHRITLIVPGQGETSFLVSGNARDRVTLAPSLSGSIIVKQPRGAEQMQVQLNGTPRGQTPITIENVPPGMHQLQLTGQNLQPLDRIVEVKIGRATEISERSVVTPSSGTMIVRSTLATDTGSKSVTGAEVWVDGVLRGKTPLTLELPHGPHSVRATYAEHQSPVQMIRLPGGNERFADFEFGGTEDPTRLEVTTSASADRAPAQLHVSMREVKARELSGLWFHVLQDDGRWQRFSIPFEQVSGGVIGAFPFSTHGEDAPTATPYYVSALRTTGEEYFTELLRTD